MKLTSRQLRRIIAEEVSRVIKENMGGELCTLKNVDVASGTFTFSVGGEGPFECEMGRDPKSTAAAMQQCVAEDGEGLVADQKSCDDVAHEVHLRVQFDDPRYDPEDVGAAGSFRAMRGAGLKGNPPEIGAVGRKGRSYY